LLRRLGGLKDFGNLKEKLSKNLYEGSLSFRRKVLNSNLDKFIAKEKSGKEIEMEYLIGGKVGAPALILLHGFADDKYNFYKAGWRLGQHYQLIIPDIPGFGGSSCHQDIPYTVENITDWMSQFLMRLNIQNAFIMGCSFGGVLAIKLARKHPELIKKIILVGSAGFLPKNTRMKSIYDDFSKGRNIFYLKKSKDFDSLMNRIFFQKQYIPPLIKGYLAQDFINKKKWFVKMVDDLIPNMVHYNTAQEKKKLTYEKDLSKLNIPILTIWGENDLIFPVDTVKILERYGEVIIFKDIGHCPQMECPELFSKYVRRFLAV